MHQTGEKGTSSYVPSTSNPEESIIRHNRNIDMRMLPETKIVDDKIVVVHQEKDPAMENSLEVD